MIVSHRKNFIFLKTVKTAGTSVESYFEKWCMPEGDWKQLHGRSEYVSETGIIGERSPHPSNAKWYNHMSAYNIRRQIGNQIWEKYFKFTVVRNPFDKVISGFFMFQPGERSDGAEIRRFRTWLQNFGELAHKNRLLIAAQEMPHYLKPIELSLIDRDKYLIDGEECVDYFIRYEKLSQDIEHACNRLGIQFVAQEIPEFKKGLRHHRIPIQDYFDVQSENLIQELYAWEISKFNYSLSA
jgi:hypothetical protein